MFKMKKDVKYMDTWISDYNNILNEIVSNLIEIKEYKSKIEKKKKIDKCIKLMNYDLNIINKLDKIKTLNKKDKNSHDKLLNIIYEQLKNLYFLNIKYKKRILKHKKPLLFGTRLKNILYYIELLNSCIILLPYYYN